MTLKISKYISLPIDAVTQTIAVVARRRVGKTYTASVLCEEMIEHGVPTVTLDPTGAWWGLRSSADGKREGLKVIIIGGSHADVPLEPSSGEVIADLVVDHPGNYVIDFSQIESDAQTQRFACAFAKRLYFRKEQSRFAMHLFIDEADVFIPQNPFGEEKRMLHAFDVIVRRGGIRGIGVTMITQRPAVLNKNVLTQCETLLALQLSGSQDVDAIEHWMRTHGDKEQKAKFLATIATLSRGVCWLWSPSWLQEFRQITIRQRRTFNSSATPKAGETVVQPTAFAQVDLTKLQERIKATVELAKANDPDELRRQIATLQKANVVKDAPVIDRVEIPVLSPAGEKMLDECRTLLQDMTIVIAEVGEKLTENVTLLNAVQTSIAGRVAKTSGPKFKPILTPALSAPKARKTDVEAHSDMSGTQRKIMETIAMLSNRGLTPNRDMVARWLGIHPNGGRYGQDLAKLRADGLLDGFTLTDDSAVNPSPSGVVACMTALEGTQQNIVEVLKRITVGIDRDALAAQLGIHPNGGRFGQDLARLRTMGLIPERGTIKLLPCFFA